MKTLRSRTRISAMAAAFAGLAVVGSYSEALAAPAFNDPADVQTLTAIENGLQSATDMKGIISDYAPDAVVLDLVAPAYILLGETEGEFAFRCVTGSFGGAGG